MKTALSAFALIGLATIASAESAIDANQITCATFGVYESDPEAFAPEVGAFIDGVLTGLTAAGYGDRAGLFERLGGACQSDPSLTMVAAIRAMVQN